MSKKGKNKTYIVEDIIDTKLVNGNFLSILGLQYYKIKWKNYPVSKCSWEPE